MEAEKEKAARICATLRSIRERLLGGYDEERSPIEVIAAALREAKAQAFEEAAKYHNRLAEIARDENLPLQRAIHDAAANRMELWAAAALRSKQDAPAKKAKTAGTDHEFEWGGKWPGICGRCGGDHKPAAQPSAEEKPIEVCRHCGDGYSKHNPQGYCDTGSGWDKYDPEPSRKED